MIGTDGERPFGLQAMRKLAAISILLLIIGPFLVPVISAAAPSPVPVCCRRDGSHHCQAMAQIPASNSDAIRASNPCPMRESQQLATVIAALPRSYQAHNGIARQRLIRSAISNRYFAPIDAKHQRGPPALL